MYRQASGRSIAQREFLLCSGDKNLRMFNVVNRGYGNYFGELEPVISFFMVGIFQFYCFMYVLTAFFSTCCAFFHPAITTFAGIRMPELHANHFAHTIMQMYGSTG